MPLYDLMLLLDPGAPSDRLESILSDVQGLLESGGKVVGTYDWGTRRMTFEIDHRPDAAYHLMQFETESGGALLERVDHSLKIMDGVLRHRIFRLKDGSPPPPMP
jgi:small subunit ribosomal protein S6